MPDEGTAPDEIRGLAGAARRYFPPPSRSALLALTLAIFTCLGAKIDGADAAAEAAPTLRLDVDAREISRKLLHAREEIAAKPGPLALWYPKWIPGTHAPGGPVQNIGGLRL